MNIVQKTLAIVCILLLSLNGVAQISPGDLAKVHAHLEGMSNCTQCHTLGSKVSNEKCLECHKEIKTRVGESKGFHASAKIKNKECTVCHSDHYGRNYDIVHLQKEKFDHNDTGYNLEGKHGKKDCRDCHKKENITDVQLRKKQETYLGLSDLCVTCHEDIHKKTLSNNCQNCHTVEAFKPALKFDHARAKYQLKGKHTDVACLKCHPLLFREGKNLQQFTGLAFQNCVNCHKDPHENKFGQNCVQCHSEESFKKTKVSGQFDHSKTGYNLIGRHIQVACKLCHKVSITTPVKHEKCTDCHSDYHKGQILKDGKVANCSDCHDLTGFTTFSYSTEQHNLSKFKLEGAHLATPCFDCHKKGKDWNFKQVGAKCVDCHQDIHLHFIDSKYYGDSSCQACHGVFGWNDINFDHRLTSFVLEGKHATTSCRKCHFVTKGNAGLEQKFKNLDASCEKCHVDIHQGQFKKEGGSVCVKCHSFDNWKPDQFNHDTTSFKLDGGHKNVPCLKCHKVVSSENKIFINYKFKDILCATCHLR